MLAKFRLHYKVAPNRSVFTGFGSDFKFYTALAFMQTVNDNANITYINCATS